MLDWPWLSYGSPEDTASIIAYYSSLLILQYVSLPKASATIKTLVTPVVMDLLPNQVENGFQIGTAVGVQLDTLGKYAGVTRSGFGPNGPITLNDSDFTKFIQLAIVENSMNASLASIQTLLHTYFDNEIFVFDYLNMRISYFLASDAISLDLATLFITEGLLPKPLGVQLSSTIYAPIVTLDTFFGCRTYLAPAPFGESPLNSYVDYMTDYPFLTYQDALIV